MKVRLVEQTWREVSIEMAGNKESDDGLYPLKRLNILKSEAGRSIKNNRGVNSYHTVVTSGSNGSKYSMPNVQSANEKCREI